MLAWSVHVGGFAHVCAHMWLCMHCVHVCVLHVCVHASAHVCVFAHVWLHVQVC